VSRPLTVRGGALSRIILGIVAIIALLFIFFYNDGAIFTSIADRFTDLFISRLREDGQL
jgi:hypothetical protein